MGTPIIATDIGAPPETVRSPPRFGPDAATGWLVPPSNPERLASAIDAALELSPQARASMGARARAHVTQSFSLEAMKHKTLQVYDALLGTKLAES